MAENRPQSGRPRGTRHIHTLPRNYTKALTAAARLHAQGVEPFSSPEVMHELFVMEKSLVALLGDRYKRGGMMMGPTTLYRAMAVLAEKELLLIEGGDDRPAPSPSARNEYTITKAGLGRVEREVVNLSVVLQNPVIPPELEAIATMLGPVSDFGKSTSA